MKKTRKLIVWLLLAAMLSFTACSTSGDTTAADDNAPVEDHTDIDADASTDTQQEQETTEDTQPPPPTAAEVYAAAAEKLEQANNFKMDVTVETARFISGEVFETEETYNIEMVDRGGSAPAVHIGRYLGMNSSNQVWHLYHDNSKAYYCSDGANFSTEISFEDFLAEQLPTVLCNAVNYGSIEFAPSDPNTILFTDAGTLEFWVADEDAVLKSAQASVELSGDNITQIKYSAEYTLGGVTYSSHYIAEYSAEVPDLQDELAALSGIEFTAISDLRIPELVLSSVDGLYAKNGSYNINQLVTSYAAGGILAQNASASYYETDDDYGYKESATIGYNIAGETAFSTVDSLYTGGKFVTTVDGETTEYSTMNPLTIKNATQIVLTRFYPSLGDLAAAELKDAGSCYLIEFDFTDTHADWINRHIQETLFSDGDLLDSYASDYKLDFANGYLSIEKDSLLPTALFIDFSCTHTIEGQECLLLMQVSLSMTMADPFAVKDVTDQLPETDEPENKATPLLYEVTAPDGAKMWLFGTIHIGDERTLWLPDELYKAFDSSDALAVECDTQLFEEQIEEDELLQQSYVQVLTYTDSSTITDHISPELYEQSSIFMKAVGQFYNAEAYKPMVWSSSITGAWLDHGRTLYSEYGVDNMLMHRAREQGKEILEVESVLFQAGMMGGFSEALQEYYLEDSINSDYRSYQESSYELFELWCSGDEAALMERLGPDDTTDMTLEELALYNEYNDAMIVDRNHDMTQTAIEYMESGNTVFFAVGLAHLLGEDGMVYALREAGYTVELVSYAD